MRLEHEPPDSPDSADSADSDAAIASTAAAAPPRPLQLEVDSFARASARNAELEAACLVAFGL